MNFLDLQNSFIHTIYDETEEEDISQRCSYYDYLAVEWRYSATQIIKDIILHVGYNSFFFYRTNKDIELRQTG